MTRKFASHMCFFYSLFQNPNLKIGINKPFEKFGFPLHQIYLRNKSMLNSPKHAKEILKIGIKTASVFPDNCYRD